MRLALCQLEISWEDKEKSREQAVYWIRKAGKDRADLILLPEMSLTGFSMNVEKTGEKDENTIIFMKEQALCYHISIGFGWVKKIKDNMPAENHYTVIDRMGQIISDYQKIHPFRYGKETEYFSSGDQLSFFRIKDFICSTFLCYDLRFPEVFQAVSGTADMILVPANWPELRREHWLCLLKARAIENQVYIAGVNCVGEIGGINYSGDSMVIDPDGNVLDVLSYEEGLVICDIINNVEQIREEFPVREDRKRELYRRWLS